MIEKERIKKILVIRNDRFGEFLLNIPALRALRETYPQARIVLAVSGIVNELAGLLDCVDEVVIWDEIKKELKKHKFDLSVSLNPLKEANLKCFFAGIPFRLGYDRKWGYLLNYKLKDTKYLGNRHEVDCNLELVRLAGAETKNKSISINVDKVYFPQFLKNKLIAIHPFTSDPIKQWPLERFKELAMRIEKELNLNVIIIGLSLTEFVPDGDAIDMTNKTSLPELAALLKRCVLLISGDSGPVHLAAAVGVPVIALFRSDIPGKCALRWGPWGEAHSVIEKINLRDIRVDEVMGLIKEKYVLGK